MSQSSKRVVKREVGRRKRITRIPPPRQIVNKVSYRLSRILVLLMLPKNGTHVEVGDWEGAMAARTYRLLRPRKLFLVDPWQYQPDRGGLYGKRAKGQEKLDRVHQHVVSRFARQIARGRIEVVRSESSPFAASFEGQIDSAYIDGDHRYEGVLADLEAYWGLLRAGGALAGDDYKTYSAEWWDDGPERAIDEFARSHPQQCRLRVIGSQFILSKSDDA